MRTSCCTRGFQITTLGVVGCVLVMVVSEPGKAAPSFLHSGATDPTSEGWTWYPDAGGVAHGPVSGEDAWFVDDTSTATGSSGQFGQSMTAADVTQLAADGWVLSVRMRMPRDTTYYSAVWCAYHTGSTRFALEFQRTAGQQVVMVDKGGFQYSDPVAISDYQLVELRGSGTTASLYVDGVLKTTGYIGDNYPGIPGVSFGSASSLGTGQGNWSLVQFTPEPASLAMLGLGAVLAFRRRRS